MPRLRAILVILSVGAMGLGPATAESAEAEVVARVNGEAIEDTEVRRMMADPVMRRLHARETEVRAPDSRALARWALRKLIVQRLVAQEATRRGLAVPETMLDQAVAVWRGRFKQERNFRRWLQARTLDEESLHEVLRIDMVFTLVKTALVRDLRVTEEEIRAYYEAHKEELDKTAETVRLRVLAVDDSTTAEELRAALRDGDDFATLAREHSTGVRAEHGGDTGLVEPIDLPPLLRDRVPELAPNEVVGPVAAGRDGYLLVRLEERQAPRTKTLAEARAEIVRRLLPAKQEETLESWLARREAESDIEVLVAPEALTEPARKDASLERSGE